jgi:hypothetical protein
LSHVTKSGKTLHRTDAPYDTEEHDGSWMEDGILKEIKIDYPSIRDRITSLKDKKVTREDTTVVYLGDRWLSDDPVLKGRDSLKRLAHGTNHFRLLAVHTNGEMKGLFVSFLLPFALRRGEARRGDTLLNH